MSTSYLSFASLSKLHNNGLLVTSPIGELSNKARSYAKDPGKFSLAVTVPSATELVNFLSMKDTEEIVIPQALAEVQIGISNWLYSQALQNKITDSRTNTLALLKANFTNNVIIDDVGEMVTNNAIWLPSFVKGQHVVGAVKHDFYMWMANAYFLIQYPDVRFTVIHPLPLKEMDSLMNSNYQQIAARLELETPSVISKRERAATDDFAWPGTERNVLEFQILDLINLGKYNTGSWVVWSWGNGADSEDKLFDQMQEEILKNSQFKRDRWEEKIPDLFNPLEFYVVPEFGKLGITDRTNGASTYSPIVDRETMMDIANVYLAPSMPADHLIKSSQTVTFLYKSLQCLFVSKLNNRDGMKKISAIVPDYQLISSLDSDFGTMSQSTMEFVIQMENLLAAAEVVTPFSLLPPGITRITRLDKICVAKRVGKVKYVAFTRWQMVQDGLVED